VRNCKTSAKLACALLVFATSVALKPQQALAEKACSNKSLSGAYVAVGSGYVNNTEPYALNVLATYDGKGSFSGTVLVRSIAGNVTTNVPTQGTYQVNSDCSFTQTGTRSDGTTANYSGAIFDDGNKFALTQTDPGTIDNVKGERVRHSQ